MAWNVVALSDLHGTLPSIPPCDLLLIAGDICPIQNHSLEYQVQWVREEFRQWLKGLPARNTIFIAGNHDLAFERRPPFLPADFPATYLQDSGTTWEGLHVWGTPWQPWFFDWAFNLHEPELERKWALIPPDTDILLVHGPPRGYGDAVGRKHSVEHTGSPALLARIHEVAPRLVVFGHIHEGRGQWQVGGTMLANVTILDASYNHVHPPWEWRIEDRRVELGD
jgi:hypothetical protein